jgi:hypothetical protein
MDASSVISLPDKPQPTTNSRQSRLLIGASGGESFDNEGAGVFAGAELVIRHRYEVDFIDSFYPIETHVDLGHGYANVASVTGIAWLTDHLGISGRTEYSKYSVTQVTKGAYYESGGPVLSFMALGQPTRFTFGYIRQVKNGISNGVETNHLQGGHLEVDSRMGCKGAICFRLIEDFPFAHVLNQGDPVCDGTYARSPATPLCRRQGAIGGGVTVSVTMEFPRRRGEEMDLF